MNKPILFGGLALGAIFGASYLYMMRHGHELVREVLGEDFDDDEEEFDCDDCCGCDAGEYDCEDCDGTQVLLPICLAPGVTRAEVTIETFTDEDEDEDEEEGEQAKDESPEKPEKEEKPASAAKAEKPEPKKDTRK